MRKNQCFMCESRSCCHRIVTPDLAFDEIACQRHGDDLAMHADVVLGGALRCTLQSSCWVKRGDPYPVALPAEQHPALAMLRRVTEAYSGHDRDDYKGRQCDFCAACIDRRNDFDAVLEHDPDCLLMEARALVRKLEVAA